MANLGKTVIVAALDGTFQRKVSFLCVCVCLCVGLVSVWVLFCASC